jgi:hypothetical protein
VISVGFFPFFFGLFCRSRLVLVAFRFVLGGVCVVWLLIWLKFWATSSAYSLNLRGLSCATESPSSFCFQVAFRWQWLDFSLADTVVGFSF